MPNNIRQAPDPRCASPPGAPASRCPCIPVPLHPGPSAQPDLRHPFSARRHSNILKNVRMFSERGVRPWRTSLPALRLSTRPAIARRRRCSLAVLRSMSNRQAISPRESSGCLFKSSSISIRRWLANPLTTRSSFFDRADSFLTTLRVVCTNTPEAKSIPPSRHSYILKNVRMSSRVQGLVGAGAFAGMFAGPERRTGAIGSRVSGKRADSALVVTKHEEGGVEVRSGGRLGGP
jgi:hypothetical protein